MKPRKPFLVRPCVLGHSLALILCGLVLIFTWPLLLEYIVDSQLVLKPDTHIYNSWKKIPFAIPTDFYLFNWTNPEDVDDASVKPKFRETGPYRFSEINQKSDIVWNKNGTVTYRLLKFWYFNDKVPNGDLQEKVTIVNPIALSLAHLSRTWSIFIRKGLSFSLSNLGSAVHVTRTASQLLFEGYTDTIIDLKNSLPFLSSEPKMEKFGMTYGKNGSDFFDGVFNMGTGINSIFGKLYNWNYWTQTPYFEGYCGKIDGSAGGFFDRHPNKHSIKVFFSNVCRTLTLNYVGETKVDDILGYKYALGDYALDNGTIYPENRCSCNGECVPSGLLNISSCRQGSPFFVSLPHFYRADPYYIDLIEGVEPDRNKHEFYIILEPTTGMTLRVMVRVQVNMLLQPVDGIFLYENVSRVFAPILWFNQNIKLPDNEVSKLKLILKTYIIVPTVGAILTCIGVSLLVCVVYKRYSIGMCSKIEKKYQEQNIPLKTENSTEMARKNYT